MTSTVDYEDLTRPISDYFTKPFPSTSLVKIGTETKSENWTIKSTSERKFVKDKKVGYVAVNDTTIEPKVDLKDYGVNVEAKYQTSHVKSLTVAKNDVGIQGLKLKLGVLENLAKPNQLIRRQMLRPLMLRQKSLIFVSKPSILELSILVILFSLRLMLEFQ